MRFTLITFSLALLLNSAMSLASSQQELLPLEASPEEDFWTEFLQSGQAFKEKKCQQKGMYFRCISGYEPSYFGYVGRDEKHLDGSHLEFKVSLKYPLWGSLVDIGDENTIDERSQAVYFAYTGQYDFYFGSRYSAPVISRQQNPGIFYKYEYETRQSGYKSFSVGYFHESNGQEIDEERVFDNKVADILDSICREESHESCLSDAFNQKRANAMATDYLSRGWDYLAASTKYTLMHRRDLFGRRIAVQTDFYFTAKAYFNWQGLGAVKGREENIAWLKGIDHPGDNVYDYRTFQLTVNRKLDYQGCADIANNDCHGGNGDKNWLDYLADNTEWSLTLSSGNKLNNISYRLEFVHHFAGLFPLKLTYFNGYGENISTYQAKSHYWMIGIDLW
ncbi:phospholipase A [Thalassotalea sp. 1_MG-2023]|uniref:phospholipase A n=1 Tax=Thalassotalea sp. 1_MG-2023 TaxID=3062680 RepID=UPI0026E4494E|nr:phospholipase A [Thalassotalea sp. 1_MG-2023]MDO6427545.1 phospholipase A [Thalassotalea sp. 1_MG-2023]